LVLLIVFYYVERRATNPMLPLWLFQSRTFLGANLLTLFLYAALGEFFFVVPLNLIQIQHYSPTSTGAALLPIIILTSSLARWSGGLVDRYSPRTPLMIGPALCGVGFALCAWFGSGPSYWTGLFPAMVVVGVGLAVTIAPLTTTVMGAIDPQFSGTASGVNNAVARVAGLLAIAVLGVVLVNAFNWKLDRDLSDAPLPENVRQEISANRSKLAGMNIPKVEDSLEQRIRTAVRDAFVIGFRLVMWILAGLALASSGFAWRMIGAGNRAKLNRPVSMGERA
jgi:MFS family permease